MFPSSLVEEADWMLERSRLKASTRKREKAVSRKAPLENIAIVIDWGRCLSLEKEPDLVTFITLSLKVRLAIKILNYHQD